MLTACLSSQAVMRWTLWEFWLADWTQVDQPQHGEMDTEQAEPAKSLELDHHILSLSIYIYQIKSNQITFIVTSPQHKCLGEWNSCERAPDSAEKQQTIYLWTDSAKKQQQTIYLWTDSAKKNNKQFTYGQTVQKKKTANNLHMDRQCKKTTNNLHMDRQCKKNSKQFTYGQTVQKKLHWSIYSAPDSAKKTTTAIYIWTDSAKKQQQFTYGQYIFTEYVLKYTEWIYIYIYTHIHTDKTTLHVPNLICIFAH